MSSVDLCFIAYLCLQYTKTAKERGNEQ
jgi:hypothetical protein